MIIPTHAINDFERAFRKAFWRKVTAWLTKEPNTLLPFDEVRDHMPIKGQHSIGLKEVPLDRIVGSLGRYQDFDREFLPVQARTRSRWINIVRARYKMGEIYFVKDGNHRVSVAREWNQGTIEAYVTEIIIPVLLTPEMDEDELALQKELAIFLEHTQLDKFDSHISISCRISGQYKTLLEHISFHQWLLAEQRSQEVSISEAAISWYTNVYQPLVVAIEEQHILEAFPKLSVPDLYLWLVKYLWYLSLAYSDESGETGISEDDAEEIAASRLVEEVPRRSVIRLMKVLKDADWIESFILHQERNSFLERTQLLELRPEAQIKMTVIGQYDNLENHISVHRWYLGEQRQSDVPLSEAALSWYDKVYTPLVNIIDEQRILEQFPGRTETDLYLWIIEKQSDIKDTYDLYVTVEEAAQALAIELQSESDQETD
jgi:hypothetical protein